MKSKISQKVNKEKLEQVVLEHVYVPKDPPELVLVVGSCRTGTTALSNALSHLGLVAYMQPIKSMRRAVEDNQPVMDFVIENNGRPIISKETLGAKTEAEFFDPVGELVRAGYLANKIHLVGILREPRATLASWVKMWDIAPMDGFVRSYRLMEQVMKAGEGRCASVTYYVQEAIAGNDPSMVLEKLVRSIGIAKRQMVSTGLGDWTKRPRFDQNDNIIFFDKPPDRFVKGVNESLGYKYRLMLVKLTSGQENRLRDEGIFRIYENFAKKCEQNLGIEILED
jgi:hypothetical protein